MGPRLALVLIAAFSLPVAAVQGQAPTDAVAPTQAVGPSTEPGRVTVATNAEGAAVTIDGASVGTTPLAVQHLAPGPHRLELRRGREVVSREFAVEAGKDLRLNIDLTPQSAPAIRAAEAEAAAAESSDRSDEAADDSPWYTRWYVIGGAAVVVAAAVIVVIAASSGGGDAGPAIDVPPIQ